MTSEIVAKPDDEADLDLNTMRELAGQWVDHYFNRCTYLGWLQSESPILIAVIWDKVHPAMHRTAHPNPTKEIES